MITIGGMPVPVVCVIDVVAVRHRVVAAARTMHVGVTGMRQVRQWMLVIVVIVRRVGMAFVHVIDMSLALGACVPAARPVYVVMIVNLMLGGCHPSSLL
jgi:N-dimethylarginine dimethylaminohydrolase